MADKSPYHDVQLVPLTAQTKELCPQATSEHARTDKSDTQKLLDLMHLAFEEARKYENYPSSLFDHAATLDDVSGKVHEFHGALYYFNELLKTAPYIAFDRRHEMEATIGLPAKDSAYSIEDFAKDIEAFGVLHESPIIAALGSYLSYRLDMKRRGIENHRRFRDNLELFSIPSPDTEVLSM